MSFVGCGTYSELAILAFRISLYLCSDHDLEACFWMSVLSQLFANSSPTDIVLCPLANQTRRTPSIGLLGQNTQQQQVVAKGPSGGVQQPPTRLPDNALEPSSKPDAEAPGSVFGTTGPNVIRSSEGSSGQLQSTADGLVGKEAPRAQTRPPSSVVLGNQATLSRNSSIYLPHRSSSLLTQQSLSPSLLDGTDDSARRSSINTPSYPESTQVAARSQTPLQSQLIASQSQPTLPDSIWKRVLENKPKALQREGSSQSDLSCATTEPASREPSPLLHEGRDPSLPVPVPRMPGLTYSFGRTEIEHAPSPPISPRSRALSMGLKERDFAYEDFPGKAEHQKALAARKAARLGKLSFVAYLVLSADISIQHLSCDRKENFSYTCSTGSAVPQTIQQRDC